MTAAKEAIQRSQDAGWQDFYRNHLKASLEAAYCRQKGTDDASVARLLAALAAPLVTP
jgi:hypothetical protein